LFVPTPDPAAVFITWYFYVCISTAKAHCSRTSSSREHYCYFTESCCHSDEECFCKNEAVCHDPLCAYL